jgi:hypothetical protein
VGTDFYRRVEEQGRGDESYRFLSAEEQASEAFARVLNALTELASRGSRWIQGQGPFGGYSCPMYRGDISEPEMVLAMKKEKVKPEQWERFFATLHRELRLRGFKVWVFGRIPYEK